MIVGLLTGTLIGLIIGVLVARLGIPSFVVTLAMFLALQGVMLLVIGEGGTIPFMGMLGEKFPRTQFVITGVLGPRSNAHGPNEFLDVPTARKITAAIAHLLHAHGTR